MGMTTMKVMTMMITKAMTTPKTTLTPFSHQR